MIVLIFPVLLALMIVGLYWATRSQRPEVRAQRRAAEMTRILELAPVWQDTAAGPVLAAYTDLPAPVRIVNVSREA